VRPVKGRFKVAFTFHFFLSNIFRCSGQSHPR
jgi:hypothetical protein